MYRVWLSTTDGEDTCSQDDNWAGAHGEIPSLLPITPTHKSPDTNVSREPDSKAMDSFSSVCIWYGCTLFSNICTQQSLKYMSHFVNILQPPYPASLPLKGWWPFLWWAHMRSTDRVVGLSLSFRQSTMPHRLFCSVLWRGWSLHGPGRGRMGHRAGRVHSIR